MYDNLGFLYQTNCSLQYWFPMPWVHTKCVITASLEILVPEQIRRRRIHNRVCPVRAMRLRFKLLLPQQPVTSKGRNSTRNRIQVGLVGQVWHFRSGVLTPFDTPLAADAKFQPADSRCNPASEFAEPHRKKSRWMFESISMELEMQTEVAFR